MDVGSAEHASPDHFAVAAVRYATRRTRASEVFLNFWAHREPDRELGMDYFFWLVDSGDGLVVVDTGCSPSVARRRGRTVTCPVPEAFERLGIDPSTVDTVILTHLHYDHVGNLALFPRASIVVAEAELDFWTGPMASRFQFAAAVEPDDLRDLDSVATEGRLVQVRGEQEVVPTVRVIEVGGHTPGQLMVLVTTAHGRVLLASDAVHYHAELERDRPFSIMADLVAGYAALDRVAELVSDGAVLVTGHDPQTFDRFPPLDVADPGFGVRVA